MGALGAGRGLLASLLAGVGGNMIALMCHGQGHRSLGASGLVLGALGLVTAHSWRQWRMGEAPGVGWARALGGGCLLVLMLGVSPRSDIAAHLGGFVSGLFCGAGLAFWNSRKAPSRGGDALCAWISLALVSVAWVLALR
jgi:membrane associated rhomboid family serine protease